MNTFVIEITKEVSLQGRTLGVGEVHTITTESDLDFKRFGFNGAIMFFKGCPYKKFLWHDEFKVLQKLS